MKVVRAGILYRQGEYEDALDKLGAVDDKTDPPNRELRVATSALTFLCRRGIGGLEEGFALARLYAVGWIQLGGGSRVSWLLDEASGFVAEEVGSDELRESFLEARRQIRNVRRDMGTIRRSVAQLDDDETISPVVRQAAKLIAEHAAETPAELNRTSWRAVSWPGRDAKEYDVALMQAQEAHDRELLDRAILNTLGVAQYRVTQYAAALESLQESVRLAEDELWPADIAFVAMSLHQLGRGTEAREALARLRAMMAHERFANNAESKRFFQEAETLMGSQ